MALSRLQKIISQAGIASRREAERLIIEGQVWVNNRPVRTLGARADPDKDRIQVKGKTIKTRPAMVYLVLNKPAGYITTLKDPQRRKTVMELIGRARGRVFPVGRLDQDAEGLLILTNDGALASALAHPRGQIFRTYQVEVEGVVATSELKRLRQGIDLEDGRTLPARVTLLRSGPAGSCLRIAIREGRNRQIKRMLKAVGHPVRHLKRIAFGPVKLGAVKKRQVRCLTDNEVLQLKKVAGLL